MRIHKVTAAVAIALLIAVLLPACGGGDNKSSDPNSGSDVNPYTGYNSALYGGGDNWLCHPDFDGTYAACDGDLSATLVFANGSTMVEPHVVNTDAEFDCFYIYPTVSLDPSGNSDLNPGREIIATFVQFARYNRVCRVFAPLYRQITLAGLTGMAPADGQLAFGDVLDAFRYYVANNTGRGFILVGHSQGAGHLSILVREEIEGNAYLQEHMIAAHLIGTTINLPLNSNVGAEFAATPPCASSADIHCFISFNSFRPDEPPVIGATTLGIADNGLRAACIHPNGMANGTLFLDAYFQVNDVGPFANEAMDANIDTPFFKVPQLITGECREDGRLGYLAIEIMADINDPRMDDVEASSPPRGLHAIDMHLGIGDLVTTAEQQADTWLDQR